MRQFDASVLFTKGLAGMHYLAKFKFRSLPSRNKESIILFCVGENEKKQIALNLTADVHE